MPEQLLKTAEKAARAAGDEVMRRYESGVEAQDKGFREWVTEADLAAQHAALAVIRGRYPEHDIIAEEGHAWSPGANGEWSMPEGLVWLVDPLDGTSNYARRLPLFNVSIAVAEGGNTLAGVVYDPLHDNLFSTIRGQGAALDGYPLQVGKVTVLADAIIAFENPRDPALRQRTMLAVQQLSKRCRTVRSLGSAALGLAYVAAGRLDVYLHMSAQPWDFAAGALLAEEAGAEIRQASGKAWRLGQGSLLACNAALMEQVLGVIA